MASSDSDDDSVVPEYVDNYHFVDDKDEPASFTAVPILWSKDELPDGWKEKIFLHGVVDNGLQKLYKQIIAWNFDLSSVRPEISVLAKENIWIKLQKPRKSYEDTIRTILITVHCLHFLKKNPEMSEKSLWDQLSRVFCLYDVKPSKNDLVDHLLLLSEAVKRDDNLAKSKFLLAFLEDQPRRKKLSDEAIKKPGFIVDDGAEAEYDESDEDDGSDKGIKADEDDGSDKDVKADEDEGSDGDDKSDEEDDVFDSVCAFCDNGGGLLCCDGECLRSFHPTPEHDEESKCDGLGLTADEVKEISIFLCKNCEYKQHQCFICGKLGSSAKSSNAEVFRCVTAGCGRFYHPQCVAEVLHKANSIDSEELQKKIAGGQPFTCPIHKCCVCQEGEEKEVFELQFAVCRRCPKSYHRKCLPREILFEDDDDDDDEGILARAWEGLLPNRVLIYCLDHEIDEYLKTPIRNHIKFPGDEKKKTTVEGRKTKRLSVSFTSKEKAAPKKRRIVSENRTDATPVASASKKAKTSSAVKEGENMRKHPKAALSQNPLKKVQVCEAPKKSLKVKAVKNELDRSLPNADRLSLGNMLYERMKKGSELEKLVKLEIDGSEENKFVKSSSKNISSTPPTLDADSERRILALMKEAASSVAIEKIIERHRGPSTHVYSSKYAVDKNITQGKIEGAVEAIRTALKRLDEGGSIEDARAVCGPEIVGQIFKWKNKLKVYLAPFLYGMRYTSFGRHFTKVDKLQEIVDKLHWYVQNGDMIVDFCCGANDFSCLMKNKLDETGKKCSYRNFDIIQPKNDFSFEKRDWMKVRKNELPEGSNLIMGLNPPFGVKAALANKFINKALEFKPKLIILIVPPETERLDCKQTPYDLIWEDENFLSGKSFYLPGSVDLNDKQMDQWNVTAPLLYLWSRQDWTAKHNAVAQEQGHLSMQQNQACISDNPVEHHANGDHVPILTDELPEQKDELLNGVGTVETKDQPEDSCQNSHESGHGKIPSNETSRSRRHFNESDGKRSDVSSEDNRCDHQPPTSELDIYMGDRYAELPNHSPRKVTGDQFLYVNQPRQVGEAGYWHGEAGVAGSRSQLGAAYGGNITDDIDRRYGFCNNGLYGARSLDEQYMHIPGARSLNTRTQIHQYGLYQQDHLNRANHIPGHDTGYGQMGVREFPYGHVGLGAESSYRIHASMVQRYAPQQDELNRTRMQALGFEPPMVGPGVSPYESRASQPGYPPGSAGFAPGPHQVYSRYHSSGWLDE